MKICVLGAGVVGLNTALELQKQIKNIEITIVAERFNESTTSDGAAGLFQPIHGCKGPNQEVERQWLTDSYKYYTDVMNNKPESGVISLSGGFFSDISQEACEVEFLKNVSPDYRIASAEDKKQYNIDLKYGSYFSTFLTPCRKYLPWALNKFKSNGGKVYQAKVNDIETLALNYNVIFNCSGLNSRYLFNDDSVIPVRGVIVQVLAPWIKNFCVRDNITYIIPCGYDNIVSLGGTTDFGNFDSSVDPYIIQSVRYRCSQLLPKLRTAPVVRKWVGFRPYRHMVRVETEIRNNLLIIHNYGHGGSGVTASPGTSIHAVKLFDQTHRASGSCKL